eukprot:m.51412 g.51412  ORF g.51412 m.51412 type:complete len:344 (-) comp12987_c0_seq1:157-1188(-)
MADTEQRPDGAQAATSTSDTTTATSTTAAAGAPSSSAGDPCVFVKKRPKTGGLRGRKTAEEAKPQSESDEEETDLKRKQTAVARNPLLTTSTKAVMKNTVLHEEDDEAVLHAFKASRTAKAVGPEDGGATKSYELDTAFDRDGQAIFERAQALNKALKEGEVDESKYLGQAGYESFLSRKETQAGNAYKGFSAKGPLRAPTNVRATVRWDYQPDICKDYKETGYCGFGDSCKFLHDRSDYKHGWQIDREIEQGVQAVDVRQYEISDEEEELPFACFICRESYTNPIMTKCKHYFCEKCFLDRRKKTKSTKCPICNANADIFFPAKDVIAKMNKIAEESRNLEG